MKSILLTCLLLASVAQLTSPAQAQAQAQAGVPHRIIEGTTSPDGRYAVAWGIPYETIDPEDVRELDIDRVRNFLVDLTNNQQIATLPTTYFAAADFVKNHGSISVSWRRDSRALFVVEGGKWGFDSAAVVYITHPESEFDQCSDVIPLSQAIRRAVRDEMRKAHPELGSRIDSYVVGALPESPTWDDTVTLLTTAEIPKDPDTLFFERPLTVSLPGPDLLKAAGGPGKSSSNSDSLITSTSVGPIELGMTIDQARLALPTAQFSRSSDGEGIAYVAIVEKGEPLMELSAGEYDPDAPIDGEARIEFIQVWSPRFRTADGIGTGMSVAEAEEALGRITKVMRSEIESREYATFTRQPSGLSFRLGGSSGAAGDYPAGESITERVLPGASIFTIEVSGPHILQDASIAGIKLDDTARQLLIRADEESFGNVVKGKDEIWEAFGQAVQTWSFPAAGLSFDMLSDEIGGPKSVFSITVQPPATAATGLGIRIGDPREKVMAAYRAYESTTEDAEGYFGDADVYLVGSIYGGMIFTFENGKVSQIFLGAAAE